MRITHLTLDITVEDLNELLREFIPDSQLVITSIDRLGIHGQLRFLFWNVDFVAKPSSPNAEEVSIEVTAHKLVSIPPAIIERQLREAVKDAPEGVEVLQQALRLNVPLILQPFGVRLGIRELETHDGFVRIALRDLETPRLLNLVRGLRK
ncbi:MAG: hypothetical protein K6T63_12450 [Alicyclobacillus herbarius]|uniref:hypothetical protein n=1 Tax=Alicyclobacillus herbarius TaxID=122960 RepID=UPI00041E7D65|nr:hypothetical protein [Alicyclobacillus herbarius]MCL6633428.1 hypothetical protein [Alicyclobacillus herbarius]